MDQIPISLFRAGEFDRSEVDQYRNGMTFTVLPDDLSGRLLRCAKVAKSFFEQEAAEIAENPPMLSVFCVNSC